ncbi:hypothetical protein EVAR_85599_1 [Eumeta japonica]|uniref:Uncharacterized protein n=1 Tax=Eumeta variegata TaxID=151549 RepID=A0A4C1XVF9_EUMVA|nr:hypothetical protein EVAR_85599_1 [Eumeta japonica]
MQATREQAAIATHGHLQPKRSHQYIATLLVAKSLAPVDAPPRQRPVCAAALDVPHQKYQHLRHSYSYQKKKRFEVNDMNYDSLGDTVSSESEDETLPLEVD